MRRLGLISLFVLATMAHSETVGVFFDPSVEQIKFAAGDVKEALESKGYTVDIQTLATLSAPYANKKVIISVLGNAAVTAALAAQGAAAPTGLGEQAYALRTTSTPQKTYWVIGGDANGAMYGGFQITENIKFSSFDKDYSLEETPYVKKRGIKFNLPMDGRSPTFRNNFSSTSHQVAIANVWDMTFWTEWFDQMARFRYNDLSIWTDHPFTVMINMPDYPEVALQNVQDVNGKVIKTMTIDEKVLHWKKVMEYGHNRGFDFYFFVWSFYIHASNTSKLKVDSKGVADANNASNTTYIRKCMKLLLETYPYINGFGVTAGEDLNAGNAVQWMYDTYGAGMKDYVDAQKDKSRKLSIVIRQFMATNTGDVVAKFKPLTDVGVTLDRSFKYSQGHMYNTEVPDYNSKGAFLADLEKYKIKTWLTVRNDGVFVHHWGDPGFARKFVNGWPNPDKFVQGFYMGGDGYTFTRVFTAKNSFYQNQLEIRRLWYTFMIWGRLSFNPNISDDVFKQTMAVKFPSVSSENLFNAWAKASTAVPLTTELLSKEWYFDFHWWPEACASVDGFRTIGEFAGVNPGPGSNRCSIAASATNSCAGKPTSYQTADLIGKNAQEALNLIAGMGSTANSELGIALNYIRVQAYLGLYYSDKIRGATYNKATKKDSAKVAMGRAYCNWVNYENLMDAMHTGMNMNRVANISNWKMHHDAVLREYTGLGGAGAPVCPDPPVIEISKNATSKDLAQIKSGNAKQVSFYLPTDGRFTFSIFDPKGLLITKITHRQGKRGLNNVEYAKRLKQGDYVLLLEVNGETVLHQIQVVGQ